MASGNTISGAEGGQMTGRPRRRGLIKAATLLGYGVLCYAVVASSVPTLAQVSGIGTTVTVPNAITGSTTLTGTIDGGGLPGYFVANGGTPDDQQRPSAEFHHDGRVGQRWWSWRGRCDLHRHRRHGVSSTIPASRMILWSAVPAGRVPRMAAR